MAILIRQYSTRNHLHLIHSVRYRDWETQPVIVTGKQLDTPENIQRLIDSGLKGAIGGGAMGAGASLLMRTPEDMGMTKEEYDNLSPDKKKELDTKFEEEVIGEAFDPVEVSVDKDNPSDDSIVTPVYVPDKVVNATSKMGVQKESLANLSPEQVVDTQEAIAQAMMGERDINTIIRPEKTSKKTKVQPREQASEATVKPPARRLKVTDNTQLDSLAPVSKKVVFFLKLKLRKKISLVLGVWVQKWLPLWVKTLCKVIGIL